MNLFPLKSVKFCRKYNSICRNTYLAFSLRVENCRAGQCISFATTPTCYGFREKQ